MADVTPLARSLAVYNSRAWLSRPFGNRELAARVAALLRRPRAGEQAEVYDDGRLLVKFGSPEVSVAGRMPGGPGSAIEAVRGFGYRYVPPVSGSG